MVTTVRSLSLRCLAASLMLSAISASADDAEGVVRLNRNQADGVVRISDQAARREIRGQSPDLVQATHRRAEAYCPPEGYSDYAEYEDCPRHCGMCGCLRGHCAALHQALQEDCDEKHAWCRGKFGYFVPTGCCGQGAPPVGCYSMVYPIDPNYFDNRDGQVYAAPGYAGPVSVPLAPVVNYTYNYGWGVPSSRITPVLHPATQTPVAIKPMPYPAAPVAQ